MFTHEKYHTKGGKGLYVYTQTCTHTDTTHFTQTHTAHNQTAQTHTRTHTLRVGQGQNQRLQRLPNGHQRLRLTDLHTRSAQRKRVARHGQASAHEFDGEHVSCSVDDREVPE